MKYAVVRISNNSFKIEQSSDNLNTIKDKYFELCRSYLAQASIDATIEIIDGNLDLIEGGKYKEHIVKVPAPAQTPAE